MQESYELLDNLDVALEVVMTGADTNPATLAVDLTTFRGTLASFGVDAVAAASATSVNNTILELNNIIVSLFLLSSAAMHI